MKNIILISGITFQEGLRNRILASIVFFAVVIFALNFILSNSFNYELSKVAVDISMTVISLCSLLIIFILCINQLARDIERRIVFLFLARPLARYEYILGKFLGFAFLLLVTEALLGAGGGLSIWVITVLKPAYVTAQFNWPTLGLALIFHFIGCLILLATAIFFTVFSSTSFLAVLYTMGVYFAGHYLERVIGLLKNQAITDQGNAILAQFLTLVSWLLPNLAAFDLKQQAAYGLVINPVQTLWTLLYGIIYTVLVLLASIILFSRKELS